MKRKFALNSQYLSFPSVCSSSLLKPYSAFTGRHIKAFIHTFYTHSHQSVSTNFRVFTRIKNTVLWVSQALDCTAYLLYSAAALMQMLTDVSVYRLFPSVGCRMKQTTLCLPLAAVRGNRLRCSKAARQGHQHHLWTPPGVVCQKHLWFKASSAINIRVNHLPTGHCPEAKISINCPHSSSLHTCSTLPRTAVASLVQCLAFTFEELHLRLMRIHINLQAHENTFRIALQQPKTCTETFELQRALAGVAPMGVLLEIRAKFTPQWHLLWMWQTQTASCNICSINMISCCC